MQISWLTRSASTSVQVAAVQAEADAVVDASAGSITLAFVEAVNGVVLWLQGLIAQAIALARLTTSFGANVDSFVGQFAMTRLPAVAASGSETFGVLTAGSSPIDIAVGTLISTGPGGTQFAVTLNTTNAAYNPATGGYTLVAGATSVTLPVQCTVAGTVGNVAANTITSPVTPIIGIDTYANAAAFTNGVAAESDAALKTRFALYIQSRASATAAAIVYAATSVQQGVRYQLVPASPQVGFYTLYVDDGSGAPPTSFVTAITAAVQAVTAEGITPSVQRFTPLVVSISCNLSIAPGAVQQTVIANVSAAIAAYVAGLQPTTSGMTLPYLELPVVIAAADPNVTGIVAGSLTVNGGTSDIAAAVGRLISASITVG